MIKILKHEGSTQSNFSSIGLVPLVALALTIGIIIVFNVSKRLFYLNQYSYLADAFLHGRLYFDRAVFDNAVYNGRHYWPLGVFPTFLLIPLVAVFGVSAPAWVLQSTLVVLCAILMIRIALKEGYSSMDAKYWALALIGGSMFFGQSAFPSSYYFAQIIAVTTLLIAIYESLAKKRWWIIGCCIAVLLMTRPIAAGAFIFFAWYSQSDANQKFSFQPRALTQLLVPISLAVIALLWYNFARFGSAFEQGYNFQTLAGQAKKGASYGLFSPVHIPGNLYYMLIAPPAIILRDEISKVLAFPYFKYDFTGTGMLITSPWLIYLWFVRYKERFQKVLIGTIFVMVFPIICYYGIGTIQLGYRYALDFFPLIVLLLMRGWKQTETDLSLRFRLLILFSVFINIYLLFGLA